MRKISMFAAGLAVVGGTVALALPANAATPAGKCEWPAICSGVVGNGGGTGVISNGTGVISNGGGTGVISNGTGVISNGGGTGVISNGTDVLSPATHCEWPAICSGGAR